MSDDASPQPHRDAFEAHLAETKVVVDRALAEMLQKELAMVDGVRADVGLALKSVSELSLRGGKRFRAGLCAAAYLGHGGKDLAECVPALVALELLQVYLLIHDDWMDGDEIRRGGKSVPARMREVCNPKQADAWSILAGDYTCALAQKALSRAGDRAEPARMTRAFACFADMQCDVVLGQMLDVSGLEQWGTRSSQDLGPIELVYRMKTGAYTVRGPLALGAILAGASQERVTRIESFADSLGVAFQLTDDLLSTFGAEQDTGKPAYGDLREGKLTWLAMKAMGTESVRTAMEKTFGRADASQEQLAQLARAIEASGAKDAVIARARTLSQSARAALPSLELSADMQKVLSGAIDALTERAS